MYMFEKGHMLEYSAIFLSLFSLKKLQIYKLHNNWTEVDMMHTLF